MALSDLISRPLTAPLEGFDKAVGVGFELAQKQDQLRIAREQLNIRQEEIRSEYLSKGMNALSVISKTKNSAQRKALYQTFIGYMEKGGMPFNPETIKALLSSEETTVSWAEALERGKNKHPDDPVLAWAEAAEIANKDPDQAVDATLKLRQAQLSSGSKQSLEEYKTSVERKKAALLRFQNVIKNPTPPALIQRGKELYPNDPNKQAEYLELYHSSVGNRLNNIRAGIRAGLPEAKKNPEKFKELNRLLNEAESSYIPDTEKSTSALQEAERLFGELKGAYKPTAAKQERPKDILDQLASAQRVLEKALTPEQKTRVDQLNQIIATANNPEMRKNPFAGQGALSALGRVNDPRSSIREEEYKRIARESGTALEGVKAAFERAFAGNALTDKQWSDLNRVANFYQQKIKVDLDRKIKAIRPRLKRAGITDDEIYSSVQPFEKATYGIAPESGKEKSFYPTPSGKAPAASTSTGKKRWSLKAYRQKNPSLTEDQYKRAREMAIQSGREVVE